MVRSRFAARLVAAVIPAALALAGPAPAAAQQSGAVTGWVRDALTGRPVAGVEVRLIGTIEPGPLLASARTGRGGRYRIRGVAPGAYHLHAATSAGYVGELSDGTLCDGHLSFSEEFGYHCGFRVVPPASVVEVTAGATVEVSFALDLGGAIAGRVTAAATGDPVAGAGIAVTSPEGYEVAHAATDGDGRYRARGLPAGVYRVSTVTDGRFADEVHRGIHCDGRIPIAGDCDPRAGEPVHVALRNDVAGIDFELEHLGTIAGRIVAAETGEPLAGVKVSARRNDDVLRFGFSGPDGRYRVRALLAGEYRLTTFETPERADERYPDVPCVLLSCNPSAGTPVRVAIDQAVEGIDFALDPGGSISGSVTVEDGGAPLEGVTLWLFDEAGVQVLLAVTEADGRYRFAGLPAGDYRVVTTDAVDQGLTDEAFDGVACGLDSYFCSTLDGVTPVAVRLGKETAGVDFSLEPLGAIAGRVTDAETGSPQELVQIWIVDPRNASFAAATATTDIDGRFLGGPLPRGEYTVFTERGPFSAELIDELYDDIPCFFRSCDPATGTPVRVASGTTTGGIDFSLRRGAAIEGRVTLEATGRAARSTHVAAVGAAGRFVAGGEVEEDGRYRLPGLVDGDYRVLTFSPPGLVDELHDRIQCVYETGLACDLLEGTPVHVEVGAAPPTVDFALASGFRPGVPCRTSPTRLCLAGERFEVGVKRLNHGLDGFGRARPVSDAAGAFIFFAGDNVETVVRLVDACGPFDRFWVLAAGLSDLGVSVGVRDTVSGEARFYGGLESRPALDTAAFETCAEGLDGEPVAAGVGAGSISGGAAPGAAPADPPAVPAATSEAPPGACVPGPTMLCLLGGRFAVEAEWADGASGGGAAGAVSLGDRSGYLWFHRPGSPEVAVKALDACALPSPGFWIFASGLTDSDVTLTVTDTLSGESREYTNPLGNPFTPIRDFTTFRACP
jgi:5-hydroxyisourate hydrolase-like protein (transthyretin family)